MSQATGSSIKCKLGKGFATQLILWAAYFWAIAEIGYQVLKSLKWLKMYFNLKYKTNLG